MIQSPVKTLPSCDKFHRIPNKLKFFVKDDSRPWLSRRQIFNQGLITHDWMVIDDCVLLDQ